MNKRVAIGIAVALIGLILVTGLGLLFAGGDRRLGATNNRSYASANYVLELDGVNTGFLKGVKGCGISAKVIHGQPGANKVVPKHIAQPVYEPCVIEVGTGMGQGIYNWIAAMVGGTAAPKNVKIITADYSYKEQSRVTLTNASLTKVKFPAAGAAAKDAAYLELTLTPEQLTKTAGTGASVQGQLGKANQKQFLPANFRFQLNGVSNLAFVSEVSSLEVAQEAAASEIGELRDYAKEPGKLDVGDLVVTISAAKSGGLDSWFDDFVVKGMNAQTNEKSGSLEFLSPNRQDVLFTLSLQGIGIFRADELPKAATDSVARKAFSLYAEQVAFSAPGVTAASTTTTTTSTTTTTTTTTTTHTTTQESETKSPALEATITPIAAEFLRDGETFTISDGVNEPTTFEFDLDGVAKAGVPIQLQKGAAAADVAATIAKAINGVERELMILATPTESAQIQLKSEEGGEAGEEKILEFVEDERFKVQDRDPAEEQGLAAPIELKAATGAGEGEIDLSWQPSKAALGYLVLLTTEPGGEYHEFDKTEGTELTLAGLKSGVTHYIVVRALDGTNESKNSNEASATAG